MKAKKLTALFFCLFTAFVLFAFSASAECAQHDFEWVKYSQTCTLEGRYEYTCKVCGYVDESKTEKIPPHNYDETRVVKIPTCTEKGTVISYCSWCMDVKEKELDIDSYNHSFGLWSVTKEPTCTVEGEQERICSRCKTKETKPVITNPTKHTDGEWVTVNEATCYAEGLEKTACTGCKKEYTRPIPIHYDYETNEADYTVVQEYAGTCIKHSWKTYNCKNCLATFTVTGDYNKDCHDFSDESLWEIPEDASCKNTVKIIKHCKSLYTHTVEEDYTAPHDFSGMEIITKEPVCAKVDGETVFTDGEKTVKCLNCDAVDVRVIKDTHGFGNWKITEGTCGNGGKAERTCMCGDVTETKPFGKDEHPDCVWDGKTYVEGTCLYEGYKYVWCNVCNKYTDSFTADLASKGGHVPGKWVVKEPATCDKSGLTDNCCKVCGEVIETVTAPKLSHSLIIILDGVEATCTDSGVTPYCFCMGCKTVFAQDTIPALGHNFVEQKTPEEGAKKICDRCYEYEIVNDGEEQVTCKCLCHNTNGLAKFIYKVITFFSKLFGINQECKCGVLHY